MSDLISRKQAIDAVCKYCEYYYNENVIQSIKEIPSAQPEIILCKDCKYAEVADPEDSQDGYICQFHRGCIWFSGSYCSYGERADT